MERKWICVREHFSLPLSLALSSFVIFIQKCKHININFLYKFTCLCYARWYTFFFNIRSDFNTFKLFVFVFVNLWMCVSACVYFFSPFLCFILLSFAFSLAATHFFLMIRHIHAYYCCGCFLLFEFWKRGVRRQTLTRTHTRIFFCCYSVHMNDGW